MRRHIRIIISLLCILAMLCPLLSGCASSVSDGCTIWLYQAQSSEYYKEYSENPVLAYLLSTDEFKDAGITLDFIVPPSGTAQDNYSTMITSGDFPTIMQNSVSDPAPTMLADGYILDFTDYVREYMPNYYSLIESSEELKNRVVYIVVTLEIWSTKHHRET